MENTKPHPGYETMTKAEKKALRKSDGIIRNSDGTPYVDPNVFIGERHLPIFEI